MSWQAARIIDFHAHVVLEETFGAAGEHGPELTIAEDGRPLFRAGGYRLHGVRYRGSPKCASLPWIVPASTARCCRPTP